MFVLTKALKALKAATPWCSVTSKVLGLKCGVRNVSGHFLFAISEKKVNGNGSTPEVAHQKIEINLSQPLKKS